MAYSRWNRSRWFVFGTTPPEEPPEKQELSIHDVDGAIFEYSFLKLKNELAEALQNIQAETGASAEEMSELKGYINEFLTDVESPRS